MMIWKSETYLESSTNLNDNSLQIEGYNLVRADHPNDIKKGEFAFILENHFLLLLYRI